MATKRTIGVMARLLDQQDGLGVYARHTLEQLVTLDRDTRYVLFLATAQTQHLFKSHPNVETHVLPATSNLWWDQVCVPRAARRMRVDLLFNLKFSLPLFTSTPSVFVLQSCDWYVNPDNYPWWDNLYIRLTLPLYCRKASGLLSISQATLDELARRTGMKLTGAGVTHAGVGPNFTPHRDLKSLAAFRRNYDLPPHYIFTVARVLHTGLRGLPYYPGGNNERLMNAYRQYRRTSDQPLPLVVAGRGVQEYLRARGFSASDLEGVRFLGFVPNETLHHAYQLAECFVLATLCESFGIPILEALSTGCPAIVPATGAAPEVVGGAACLIDPYSEADIARALLEVTGSEALRQQLARDGLQRSRVFSWQHTARRVLKVFDEILSPGLRAGIGPQLTSRGGD